MRLGLSRSGCNRGRRWCINRRRSRCCSRAGWSVLSWGNIICIWQIYNRLGRLLYVWYANRDLGRLCRSICVWRLTRGLLGKGLSWGGFGLDVAIRPLFNQLAKIGTGRQSEMNWSKYGYDVATRALTYAIPSPWRSFARGITRGHWSVYGWGLPNGQNATQFYYV